MCEWCWSHWSLSGQVQWPSARRCILSHATRDARFQSGHAIRIAHRVMVTPAAPCYTSWFEATGERGGSLTVYARKRSLYSPACPYVHTLVMCVCSRYTPTSLFSPVIFAERKTNSTQPLLPPGLSHSNASSLSLSFARILYNFIQVCFEFFFFSQLLFLFWSIANWLFIDPLTDEPQLYATVPLHNNKRTFVGCPRLIAFNRVISLATRWKTGFQCEQCTIVLRQKKVPLFPSDRLD